MSFLLPPIPGAVDKVNFRKLVTKLLGASVDFTHPDADEIDSIFDELDIEGNGKLALAEVRRILLPSKEGNSPSAGPNRAATSSSSSSKSTVGKKGARVAPMPPS